MRNILPIFLLQHKNSPNFLTSHTEIDLLYDDASSSSRLAKVHNRTGLLVGLTVCISHFTCNTQLLLIFSSLAPNPSDVRKKINLILSAPQRCLVTRVSPRRVKLLSYVSLYITTSNTD